MLKETSMKKTEKSTASRRKFMQKLVAGAGVTTAGMGAYVLSSRASIPDASDKGTAIATCIRTCTVLLW